MVGATRGTPEGFRPDQASGSQHPPPPPPNLAEVIVAEPSELFRFKCTSHHLQRHDDLKCTSNGITHGSVGSPPDATTVTQNRSRLYSYKTNSRYITAQTLITE
jgi:hypothetical protein